MLANTHTVCGDSLGRLSGVCRSETALRGDGCLSLLRFSPRGFNAPLVDSRFGKTVYQPHLSSPDNKKVFYSVKIGLTESVAPQSNSYGESEWYFLIDGYHELFFRLAPVMRR